MTNSRLKLTSARQNTFGIVSAKSPFSPLANIPAVSRGTYPPEYAYHPDLLEIALWSARFGSRVMHGIM